jgi:hypothetical protein
MFDDSRQEPMAIVIAIAPNFSAFLSIVGSTFIIQDILRSHWKNSRRAASASSSGVGVRNSTRSRRCTPPKTLHNSAFYRLILGLSLSDWLLSIAWFMTTWPIPKDEYVLDNPSETVYGNSGSTQTCAVQGFFIQLGIMSPMYNSLLACYYYMAIRYGWGGDKFKRRIEYAGHAIAIGFGLGTSIAGSILELYNHATLFCWIAPYPAGCDDEAIDQVPCVRAENAIVLRWVFYYCPLLACLFFAPFFMIHDTAGLLRAESGSKIGQIRPRLPQECSSEFKFRCRERTTTTTKE